MKRKKPPKNKTAFPDTKIESLARCFLPYIREFYESEEGQREFEEWRKARAEKEKKESVSES